MKKLYYLVKTTQNSAVLCSGGYTNKKKLKGDHSLVKCEKYPYYIGWQWNDEDGQKEFKRLQYLQKTHGKIIL